SEIARCSNLVTRVTSTFSIHASFAAGGIQLSDLGWRSIHLIDAGFQFGKLVVKGVRGQPEMEFLNDLFGHLYRGFALVRLAGPLTCLSLPFKLGKELDIRPGGCLEAQPLCWRVGAPAALSVELPLKCWEKVLLHDRISSIRRVSFQQPHDVITPDLIAPTILPVKPSNAGRVKLVMGRIGVHWQLLLS